MAKTADGVWKTVQLALELKGAGAVVDAADGQTFTVILNQPLRDYKRIYLIAVGATNLSAPDIRLVFSDGSVHTVPCIANTGTPPEGVRILGPVGAGMQVQQFGVPICVLENNGNNTSLQQMALTVKVSSWAGATLTFDDMWILGYIQLSDHTPQNPVNSLAARDVLNSYPRGSHTA